MSFLGLILGKIPEATPWLLVTSIPTQILGLIVSSVPNEIPRFDFGLYP